MFLSLDEVEASRETTTAIANSRMRLRVARMCLSLGLMQTEQSATSRIMLMMKVRIAAMIMKAAYWSKFLFW